MKKQPGSSMFCACGMDDPAGLHLYFYEDDEGRVVANFTPSKVYQGYLGAMHGGVICALLDVPTQIPVHSGVLAV